MTRINTNVQSQIAQRVLNSNNGSLNTSLERLSTGLRINRGKDDPAGLIASEKIGSTISSLNAAVNNATRADQVVNIAEGGLQEISGMLTELQGLLTASANDAGLSREEKEANQLQIDSILQTIDRIAGATEFQGTKLLNGNFDYTTSNVSNSVTDFRINGAKFETASLSVDVLVTQSARQGQLAMDFGGTALDLTDADARFRVEIGGAEGARELSFGSGTTLADVTTAINQFTDVTGVTATASGDYVRLNSDEYGSDQFVTVKVLDAAGSAGTGVDTLQALATPTAAGSATAFASANNGIRNTGQDIGGTINGIQAVGKGREISINTDFLDVEVTLDAAASYTLGAVNAFDITGGGADFQLGGDVNIQSRVSLGIGDVSARKLGNSDLGFLNELASGKTYNVVEAKSGDFSDAQKIVEKAIDQVSTLRGRLGAFQSNVIAATSRNLQVTLENTEAARSVIRDTDFAKETAALTRGQILQQSSLQTLSLANQAPQAALSLLG